MPGLISWVVGGLMMLGGLGAMSRAHELGQPTSGTSAIWCVGGLLMLAAGRIIQLLYDIRSASNPAQAKETTGLPDGRSNPALPSPTKKVGKTR